MSCFAEAVVSPLMVNVGDTVCFIAPFTVLVATGWPVVGSAGAEGFEELGACGWTMSRTDFRSKCSWQFGFEFVTCSECAS